MYNLDLNIVSTLILSIVLYLFGNFLTNKIYILNKLCIPSPVVGGLTFSLFVFILEYFKIVNVSMNTLLMPYFMSFFFTIVGLNVSFKLLKKGGKVLIIYWLLCALLGFSQNIITFVSSKLLNINPLLGLMCGNISMEGGHGYSLAFGRTLESLGVTNACSVGFASATLGLIMGGIIGGPVAKILIEKYHLKSSSIHKKNKSAVISSNSSILDINETLFFEQILIVLVSMSIGSALANIINVYFHIVVPSIVGCIFIAVLFRNFNDKAKIMTMDFKLLNFLQELSLGMFLTMALMSIDFFTLSSLFGPIVFIVICQVLFIVIFTTTLAFRALGKDYDAAVMISGMLGHGLGATPNALANMGSITNKYGHSQSAYLVVPLVAAFLLDIFSIPCILFFINILT
ncbi:sodium/glutamate symporter [Terrisporobacter hibernicus]|uniref:Sodium/glutamate symporter n=1 Tax=Terrisporobacter hibernicus TaxID=2813371 RepID=A0AAX2ZI71_9FIRM|nr:sodium/glutamate symporter [Terrisporobacter hibernicus]UEL47392.1 sodium:glutamate symporter [Terrisporobacter hibernicus]SFJ14015.1 glutamate:Na+ symporter, ESS family [Terrisporobacter glycolicus]